MKYNEATERLRGAWDAKVAAREAWIAAAQDYLRSADELQVTLCAHCDKPMPDHDSSQTCDGCHLPWGWDTPQGRRDSRADQLDHEIERLRAERAKL